MHSLTHRHLLAQLGCLYGGGMLSDRRDRSIYATLADQINGHGGADKLNPTMLSGSERIPVADAPIIDTMLGDPQDEAVVEIATRGGFRDSAENT